MFSSACSSGRLIVLSGLSGRALNPIRPGGRWGGHRVTNRMFGKRSQEGPPKRHAFQRTDTGGGTGFSPELVNPESGALPPSPGWRSLVRPALFCGAACFGAFAGAAIWQYENMRSEAKSVWKRQRRMIQEQMRGLRESPIFREAPEEKALGWRRQLNRVWREMPTGHRVFVPICALNVAVWMAWKAPHLRPFMLRWFACNPAGKSTCIPMLTSAFSHYSAVHLAVNMYVLHSFAAPMASVLGKEQFVGIYLASAVVSSFFSSVYKVAIGRCGYSLGASGAILAMIGVFGTVMPEAKLQIVLLPMLTFTAASALKGLVVLDSAGMLLGWKFFDHAAHLSGLLCGIAWVRWGNELLWNQRRESVMRWWHDNIRERHGGDGGGGGKDV